MSYARASDHAELREASGPPILPQQRPAVDKVLVWDVPIRAFHVIFALCCMAAFALAVLGEDSSRLFALHMVFGIAATFMLVVRLAVAILGGRHNRLRTMVFSPRETMAYFTGIVTGSARRYDVHNPATSLVALAMFAFVLVLLWTGLAPEGEGADELHAVLAYGLVLLMCAHLAGLAVHTVRHRENIATAMLTGRKRAAPSTALPTARPGWGAALLIACIAWMGLLFASYDANAQTVIVPVIGTSIHLEVTNRADEIEERD